ncbi:methionine gamma-lyase family protein [Natranaerofaba carboxydovora]|uniref:methionine gamma-lyase family protein n=1 Tax=Natranaerofaba carboxydovora TaxID=2742683 RepID=UPI001F12EDA5|nr:methionine gamma-lyase family protein [Natranaerofaba carboxydovora]UMZ73537.1 Methionine gamma-lyase [Natranaerofaba carboxydovora]
MDFNTYQKLWNINEDLAKLGQEVYDSLSDKFTSIDKTIVSNQLRALASFQNNNLSEQHFYGTTGYGYGDMGRELLNNVMAELMGTEDALVSVYWVSGTHAISDCLFALLDGDDVDNDKEILLSITGRPYETLSKVLGLNKTNDNDEGSNYRNTSRRLNYREISVFSESNNPGDNNFCADSLDNEINLDLLKEELTTLKPKVVFIQKSKGYSWRKTLVKKDMKEIIDTVRTYSPYSIIFVDNCYGEFVEDIEPGSLGADLIAGSLIKNPGGGLAPTGGYVAGREHLVNRVSEELTAPGLGKGMGATLNTNKDVIQGLYLAPKFVGEALKGAVFNAKLYSRLGYEVLPGIDEKRGDIIQAIKFYDKEKLIGFVEGVQRAGAVDSSVTPVPEKMPGYDSEVIMAAGTFIQGGSLELSADAPVIPPYIAFFQGGLTLSHSILGSLLGAEYVK